MDLIIYAHIGPSIVDWPLNKMLVYVLFFSGQHLQIISEGVLSLPCLLRLAIKVGDELTQGSARLKGIQQMLNEAFEGLVFCDHAHIELHLISDMFCSEVLHQLYGLSLSKSPILYIDMNIQPGLETSPADDMYPPLTLFIFGSHIFLNSPAAVWSPVSSRWLSDTGLGGKATSSCCLCGLDVKAPFIVSTYFTCLGWWLGVKFVSSASMSSNEALFVMGVVIVVECEATAVPYMVLTVPGIRLKISSHMTSNLDSEHEFEALES